ncbi:MAG: hypothetical protein ABJB66_21455, partial [Gemmatimonadaceae bacterium]
MAVLLLIVSITRNRAELRPKIVHEEVLTDITNMTTQNLGLIIAAFVFTAIVGFVIYRFGGGSPLSTQVYNMKTMDQAKSEVQRQSILLKECYAVPKLEWFAKKKVLPMLFYRFSGSLTIVLSAAVPAVAQTEWFGAKNQMNVVSG